MIIDRHRSGRGRRPPARTRSVLRADRVFGACGYAVAVAALVGFLLTAHLGHLAVVTGIVLAVVLAGVNLSLAHRSPRPRRSQAMNGRPGPGGSHDTADGSRHAPR